jgi:hypothetical protein
MPMNPDNPLSIFWSALCTVVGWALVTLGTSFLGVWVGLSIEAGAVVPPDLAFFALVLAAWACLVRPQILLSLAVSLVAFYLPLRIDSTRLRVGAAVVNFLAWLGMSIWVVASFRH